MNKFLEKCRFCHHELKDTFIDLGLSPLSNAYILPEHADCGEMNYPLHVKVCQHCFLVQLGEFETPEHIFSDYAYFSSYSTSWLNHARDYVTYMMDEYGINRNSQVLEIASNDGYLLQYFKKNNVPVSGIELNG